MNMSPANRRSRELFFSLALVCLLPGCIAEIDYRDLDFEPAIVVAAFPEAGEPFRLHLARTRPLWDPSEFVVVVVSEADSFYTWNGTPDLVSGAQPRLSAAGSQYTLREDSAGYYSLPSSVYRPSAGDSLSLTIEAEDSILRAETIVPEPPRDLAFMLRRLPPTVDRREFVSRGGENPGDTLVSFTYRHAAHVIASLVDSPLQRDFYQMEAYLSPPLGVDCQFDPGEGGIRRVLADDSGANGSVVSLRQNFHLFTRFLSNEFPDESDHIRTCELAVRFVQYGPAYDRFLQLDYDPVTAESGSNIEGGLGLFSGVGQRDTILSVTVGNIPAD